MSESVDANGKVRIYSDNGGTYDCTLVKYDDDKMIVDEIQLSIFKESSKYSLLIEKSNSEITIDVSDTDLQLIKTKFYLKFHDLTGNYWEYRNQFTKIPGHYYLLSNELNSLSSSEEQQIILNNINDLPKFMLNDRAFTNETTKLLKETYPYIYDESTAQIFLPKVSNENEVKSSLLSIRSIIVRIAIIYEYDTEIQTVFGSGCLITNKLVLTCAHIFDPIKWAEKEISYSKILVAYCDPCPNKCFSLLNSNNFVLPAEILQRGLIEENIDKYCELKDTATDLALLILNNPIESLMDHYFHPKLDAVCSNTLPLNSNLYMIGYHGKLKKENELESYKHLACFRDLNIRDLNEAHHVDYKSISIGNLIKDISQEDSYALHDCSSLPGSSGSIILDYYGRLVGVHIGISSSKRQKNNKTFFTEETYNKYISVYSNKFQKFICQTIIPNITDDHMRAKWLFNLK